MSPAKTALPVLGFAAFTGTGKTTLLLKLLPLLKARGYRIGVVKHAHHTFEIDHAGKDSFALRKSGVEQIVIGSRHRWASIMERPEAEEPKLEELLGELKPDALVDFISVFIADSVAGNLGT